MIGRFLLTPSLPEYLMEFCKATLTFESADEILRCDHSNESSLLVLSHDAICLSKFLKMKCGNLVEICLRPHLAVKGLKSTIRVVSLVVFSVLLPRGCALRFNLWICPQELLFVRISPYTRMFFVLMDV